MNSQTPSFIVEIKDALKKNISSAIVMLLLAGLLGIAYARIEQTAFIFDWMSSKKEQYGLIYGIISTSLFGGLIPFLVLIVKRDIQTAYVKSLVFYLLLWAFMGLLVDIFYHLQGFWFGYEASISVLVRKVALDQFVFSAFLTCPILTLCFLWRDNKFSWSSTRKRLNHTLFTKSIPKTVLTNWMIWIPAVCLIYSMPASLQLPFFNLILCLFVLILSALKLD